MCKLKDFREVPYEERISYMKLLIKFGKVDHEFADSEKDFIKKLAAKNGVSMKEFEAMIDDVEEIDFLVECLKLKKSSLVHSFFLDIVALTVVDGIIRDNEHVLLIDVSHKVGIDVNIMHNFLWFSMVTGHTQELDLTEALYSSFIDTTIDWIKALNIPIFQQTTFSINSKIDKYLKQKFLAK